MPGGALYLGLKCLMTLDFDMCHSDRLTWLRRKGTREIIVVIGLHFRYHPNTVVVTNCPC